MSIRYLGILGIVGILLLAGCSESEKRFRLVPSSESGIHFKNVLTSTAEFNILNYMYFYNGGGVAVGDFNGDSLPDLYFTANQTTNKLYLNRGNFKFEDVTDVAGVEGLTSWTTGVTTADVNGDGKLDIYVSYIGDYLIYKGRNQLFINQGNNEDGVPTFADNAVEYGLDLIGFSTQAAFFDYDKDGDLDMFMLNHSLHEQGTFGRSSLRYKNHPLAGDKILRNDKGRFVDVTEGSGIYSSVIGYGLGLVISDVNLDGWPDIYVGNDFHENDYLYLNQGNGKFVESLEQEMMHTSRFTMGVDFGDVNNDAFPDLVTMDMLPYDPQILKASASEDTYDVYTYKINFGYHHQFARNTLQINNRDSTFSDIALQAGISSTDWSWSALLCDVDLDGYKDIFVANGIPRRANDLDYINFMNIDSIKYMLEQKVIEEDLVYIEKMPQIKIPNFLFSNNRDLTFTNKAKEWGLDQPSYSNGAAYADLDVDGDLDLIVNNIEDEAFVYENKTITKATTASDVTDRHYLQFAFKGAMGNLQGIGVKVFLYDSGRVQMQECFPTRGFQSSVETVLTFGVAANPVDSVIVVWNDSSFERFSDVKIDQRIVADAKHATGSFNYARLHAAKRLFRKSAEINIPFKHRENRFVEFSREQLLPHMLSAEGPASAVADVNNDGLEDIFLGGAKWQESALFLQGINGKFVRSPQSDISRDSICEDVDAIFFDAENDGDVDLFVIEGGNEFFGKSPYRNPRLYLNDSHGNFTRSNQLKDVFVTGSCVAASDFDEDGDTDLFIGARTTPLKYGVKPDSYILINDGKGDFHQETSRVAPELLKLGFVKDAVWTDIDSDDDEDLVIAAEWNPLLIFINDNGKLSRSRNVPSGLEKSNGWWNVVKAVDMDGDGDMDIVAGNLGLNSKLHTSVEAPVKMFVGDFDKNDSTDQILTHFMGGKEVPFHTRDEMMKQMPFLKKRYLSYKKFSEATLTDIFSENDLNKAEKFEVYTFQSSVFENLGDGRFTMKPLPSQAQWSTVNAVVAGDFNHDGKIDLIIAGNFYPINIQMGRYDASYGLLLIGDGRGNFTPVESGDSGISLKGQTRELEKIVVGGKIYFLSIRNDDTVQAFNLIHE